MNEEEEEEWAVRMDGWVVWEGSVITFGFFLFFYSQDFCSGESYPLSGAQRR
jgi:hypothetical protein